ncbi:MAG: hypothetical protein IJL71_02825 [Oscillospiraceae bacterium]|nr:hypothetical protein [Oscillospiraceae bacterium]
MENGVQELLQMLSNVISEARGVPLSSDKCIIEREKTLDLIDEIKAQLPGEISEAKRLVSARNDFITNAKKEAESIKKVAEDRARQLVDEEEIVKQAKAKSDDIIATAREKSDELRRVANQYAEEILRRTEESVSTALDEIQESRSKFIAASRREANDDDYDLD